MAGSDPMGSAEKTGGLYTRRARPGKPLSDKKFWGILAGILGVCFLVPLCSILFSYHLKFDFEHYLSELSDATVYAYEHGGMTVTDGEEVYTLWGEDVYVPYFALSMGGMGKPEQELPEVEKTMRFDYGNGAWMQIWDAPIENSRLNRETGLVVRFVGPDGSSYSYSTDRAFFSSLRNLCTTRNLSK